MTTMTKAPAPTSERDALLAEMERLIARTNTEQPDATALRDLRAAMERHPEMWRDLCDLGTQTTQAIIGMVHGTPLVRELLQWEARALRDALGYPSATPMEQGLIESVVQAWLVQQITQGAYAQQVDGVQTLKAGEYWERRLTMA